MSKALDQKIREHIQVGLLLSMRCAAFMAPLAIMSAPRLTAALLQHLAFRRLPGQGPGNSKLQPIRAVLGVRWGCQHAHTSWHPHHLT